MFKKLVGTAKFVLHDKSYSSWERVLYFLFLIFCLCSIFGLIVGFYRLFTRSVGLLFYLVSLLCFSVIVPLGRLVYKKYTFKYQETLSEKEKIAAQKESQSSLDMVDALVANDQKKIKELTDKMPKNKKKWLKQPYFAILSILVIVFAFTIIVVIYRTYLNRDFVQSEFGHIGFNSNHLVDNKYVILQVKKELDDLRESEVIEANDFYLNKNTKELKFNHPRLIGNMEMFDRPEDVDFVMIIESYSGYYEKHEYFVSSVRRGSWSIFTFDYDFQFDDWPRITKVENDGTVHVQYSVFDQKKANMYFETGSRKGHVYEISRIPPNDSVSIPLENNESITLINLGVFHKNKISFSNNS